MLDPSGVEAKKLEQINMESHFRKDLSSTSVAPLLSAGSGQVDKRRDMQPPKNLHELCLTGFQLGDTADNDGIWSKFVQCMYLSSATVK